MIKHKQISRVSYYEIGKKCLEKVLIRMYTKVPLFNLFFSTEK